MKRKQLICPSCKASSVVTATIKARFCPACGYDLSGQPSLSQEKETSSLEGQSISLVHGHIPSDESIQFSIGPYKVLKSIGKGGMGEVLLAYDTICGRQIALKRIRTDLLEFRQIKNRFLKEARITSQLTHPSIIPIYAIHQDDKGAYYTMPFVEGDTLKQILKQAKEQEKLGPAHDSLGGSIPYLIRIFLAICQAIAYAHSKSVLHRDIKPENIIVGTYGEVLILDWGLAKLISKTPSTGENEDSEIENINPLHHITQLGKVVGTVGYMAPERALGQPASKETDIYSLGVILYQILTLSYPFRRKSLKEFRENMSKEVLKDPIEIAPYRDIPKILAQITLKCLSKNPEDRYSSVDALIHNLENYIEGRAEWFETAELSIANKEDWEFQEHILLAEHTAITRTAERSEWATLMVSKASFAENLKIEAKLYFEKECLGIGILFNVPEVFERAQIDDGFCLWISGDKSRSTKLSRSSVELLDVPDCFIQPQQWNTITIEKIDSTIHFYINQVEQFTYISRMPLLGTHIGILTKDSRYKIEELKIYLGSQNIMVNCLAIPDAFLAHKDYKQALSEYRRIGYAFSGRAEGRDAILRAGITLLEEAKASENPNLYDLALEEFEKLHHTAGAPLEYLGKALVYEALQETDEESKCFELAYRRYPNHPLLHTLQEQIIFRLIESARTDRKAVYHFLLLALCYIPDALNIPAIQKLTTDLKNHWEPLEFLQPSQKENREEMLLTLAFWLHRNYVLEDGAKHGHFINSLMCLAMLNETATASKLLSEIPKSSFLKERALLQPLLESSLDRAFARLPHPKDSDALRILIVLCDQAIDEKKTSLLYKALEEFQSPLDERLQTRKLWALLQDKRFDEAGALISEVPMERLTCETSLFYFLYGCWLHVTEGKEIAHIHWNSLLETPFPRTETLGSYYITGKLDPSWFKKSFDFERMQLNRQLDLFNSLL